MTARTTMTARDRLFVYGVAVLVLEVVVLIPIAVIANLPSQFGAAGTDAAAELVSRGTAITAPGVTLVVLALALLALRIEGGWAIAGAIGTGIIGVLMLVGALGEAFAPATADVSKAVLVVSGIGVGALGLGMAALAATALRARPAVRPPGPPAPVTPGSTASGRDHAARHVSLVADAAVAGRRPGSPRMPPLA